MRNESGAIFIWNKITKSFHVLKNNAVCKNKFIEERFYDLIKNSQCKHIEHIGLDECNLFLNCYEYENLCICVAGETLNIAYILSEIVFTDIVWVNALDKYGKVVLWNKGAEKISGYKTHEVLNSTKIWELLYPSKRYRDEIFSLALKIINKDEVVKDFDTTITTKDGLQKIIRWYSKNIKDENGKPKGSIAIGIDVSVQYELKEKLEREREEFETYLNLANVLFVVIDKEMRVAYVNKKTEETVGVRRDEIIGKNWFDHFLPEDEKNQVKEVFKDIINGRVELNSYYENHIITPQGKKLIAWHNTAIRDDDGNIVATVSAGEDITSKRDAEEKLRYLTFHDSLTGLYNRHFFEEELRRLNVKRNYPISVVVADADNLKFINDNFGHKEGDRFLQNVALALKNSARKDDIVARVGGDEFAVLLCHTPKEAVEKFCQRINAKCRELKDFGCSVSVGYATAYEYMENLEELVALADKQMYKDKNKKHVKKDGLGLIAFVKSGNVVKKDDEIVIKRGNISKNRWEKFIKFLESDSCDD
ncbi:sensor domain-containing diguanylate cyclase [Hippea jasoniae]|uniref:sensor domain-containing diguanylate cyclase n=1 Tax=Hippea jasoniae TaxID=944479 RepID=UPI0005509DB5|nr:sensor domain-containing diguanylate cyclase [Hippea jasoniae]